MQTRPGGRSARVQAAVHQAVTDLVCERGADQVTVPMVASRAGVNPTTVYRRWGSVPALLADVAVKQESDLPEPVGDLRVDLPAYARWVYRDLSRPGGIAFFRAEVAASVDDRKEGMRRCHQRCVEILDEMLQPARDNGATIPDLQVLFDRLVAPIYSRIVFSVSGTDEAYAGQLAEDLLDELEGLHAL
ncbi:TetR/AcrR family transcriptional regulator [Fodinicola acaciae]|uniref:TetR/AcrR family transcriptional regulator n=1 Tax=Fodinicola acaciae TaxID=2681555 RepID=UPI0013CF8B42|nr:TetR/AcrR family transcriptional regulator [Fodinicola acaciae]